MNGAADTIVIKKSGGVWQVETPRSSSEAPHLLNAAGAWSAGVGRLAGLNQGEWERDAPGLSAHE